MTKVIRMKDCYLIRKITELFESEWYIKRIKNYVFD